MKTILLILFGFLGIAAKAQVTTVDIVKVKGEYEKEALYFYENNWKVFREEGLKARFISGFQLVESERDTAGVVTLVLMTHFADSVSYANVEKNFRPIMQRVSPGGPKMLNSVGRKEFIIEMANYAGKSLWRR